MTNHTAIIILAAGASERMGTPKQLLLYRNKPLLQHLTDEAISSGTKTVIIVLGANAESIRPVLKTKGIHIVINDNWKEGMASSIRCGIDALQKTDPAAEAAILMVCDQPFATSSLLNELIKTHQQTGKKIVTSGFDETNGPPAFFHKDIFPELLQLTGDRGARMVTEAHPFDHVSIPFPQGGIDIDTAADYEALGGEK